MKKIQKILAILLAVAMILSLAACGGQNDESVVRVGVLEMEGVGATGQKHDAENHPGRQQDEIENVYYNNLSSALLDLQNEKVMALLMLFSGQSQLPAPNATELGAKM